MTRSYRQRVLALTPCHHLESRWAALDIHEHHRCVRGPETGMAMVRGRMGGTGSAFNLGEVTMTRASVALDDGTLGHGWVRGRDRRHAELIALVDACTQQAGLVRRIDDELIAPLHDALTTRDVQASRTAAATRVDFFTLVRGE
ncbi:phosphonate C-P lyase system protein PhnG [Halomonas piscis]|uniref:Phosphonate C-P lyase system protein PhnG n=1 Tax=Halomonas piscis TaxID=3031727 RepID=A0ABY9YZU7_9GAMM|nr:phosphonate C-P lyase system protein PhnG [Halomonas piscis]WNK20287.1 phosphonate C-P lyase system protein PhnG [Halomonas piscis]